MKPRVLMDGNWVRVERVTVGFRNDTVINIAFKAQPTAETTLSEDEWKEVQQAAAHDDPKDWSS
jgi:hypothetical protein